MTLPPSMLQRLREQLRLHEGLRLRLYTCTGGKLTIGIGRNIQDRGLLPSEQRALFGEDGLSIPELLRRLRSRGITKPEAEMLLDNDIALSIGELLEAFPWFQRLDPIRQRVLIDLHFNMGMRTLRTFRNTLAAFERGDFAAAARGLRASKWSRDVGDGEGGRLDRADRLIAMTRTGKDYTA